MEENKHVGPIAAYKYIIETDTQRIIGMVPGSTTFSTLKINTRGVKHCKLKIAAVNIAGVGKYSPEIEVHVSRVKEQASKHKSEKLDTGKEPKTGKEKHSEGNLQWIHEKEHVSLCEI